MIDGIDKPVAIEFGPWFVGFDCDPETINAGKVFVLRDHHWHRVMAEIKAEGIGGTVYTVEELRELAAQGRKI